MEIDVAVSVIRGFVWAISQGFYYPFAICKVDTLPALFETYLGSEFFFFFFSHLFSVGGRWNGRSKRCSLAHTQHTAPAPHSNTP
jgi:hypothetical protein